MPYKRRPYTRKTKSGFRRYKNAKQNAAANIQAYVRRAIARNNSRMIETKMSCNSSTDGTEIFHNNFVLLSNTLLKTTPGVYDPHSGSTANRIGDQISLRGVKIKMMVELNERYSDVTFRLFVIKCAKGDVPDRTTLFTGLSGNKMLDTIRTERYTILFQKYFKIKAPNASTWGTETTTAGVPNGSGVNFMNESSGDHKLSRASKIVSAWIPGKAFTKSGIITYENGLDQTKFFDYHVCLYAYSNYSTDQDLWYVGRVNDYVQQMYFKDA